MLDLLRAAFQSLLIILAAHAVLAIAFGPAAYADLFSPVGWRFQAELAAFLFLVVTAMFYIGYQDE